LIQDGDGARNEEYPLKRDIVMGREAPSDLILPHPGVSRRHARIVREGEAGSSRI